MDQALPGDLPESLHDYVAGAFARPARGSKPRCAGWSTRWPKATLPPSVHDRYDALSHRFENEGGYDMVAEVEKALSGLGFDKADFERPLAELSGGQKNRAMLARAILSSPDVLLLDEPTNHLDFHAVEFLEEYLARSRRAYLVVTHDRRFLDRVAEEIVDLENGRLSAYSGGYTAYRRQKAERDPDGDARLREAAGLHRQGEGVHPPQHRRRQLPAGEGPADEARPRGRASRSRPKTRRPWRFSSTRRASAGGASCGRRTSTRDTRRARRSSASVSFELLRGERLAILGENGTGKTTLLKTLARTASAPRGRVDDGTRRLDRLLRPGAARPRSERRRAIDAVWDQHPEETEEAMRSYLARFAFRGDEVFAPIAGLSGGEKGRLTLAVVMRQRHNLLLLDEPTNHLDLDSREALEESLEDFPGSIVFVSHDRAFIDRSGHARPRPAGRPGDAACRATTRRRRRRARTGASGPSRAPRRLRREPRDGPAADRRPRRRPGPRAAGRRRGKESARRRKRIKALEEKIAALEAEIEADRDAALGRGPDSRSRRGARSGREKAAQKAGARRCSSRSGRDSRRKPSRPRRAPQERAERRPRRPPPSSRSGARCSARLRQDTNSLWLTARLEELGIPVVRKSIVGDDPDASVEELDFAFDAGRAPVCTTGGLGPTADDVTVPAVAALARSAAPARRGVPGVDARAVRARGASACRPCNEKQADFIEGVAGAGEPARHGSRFLGREGRNEIVILPGVPSEMREIMEDRVLPRLRERAGGLVAPAPCPSDRRDGGVGRRRARGARLREVEGRPGHDPGLARRSPAPPGGARRARRSGRAPGARWRRISGSARAPHLRRGRRGPRGGRRAGS